MEDGRSYCSAGAVLPLVVLLAFFAFGGGTLLFTLLLFTVLSVVMAAAVAGTVLLMELAVVPLLHAAMRPRPAVARNRPEGATFGLPTAPAALAPQRPAGSIGDRALYRRRLLDVLKDRYVRGEITLEEFEARAAQIARDPSARHLL
jgi:hypothetical protein